MAEYRTGHGDYRVAILLEDRRLFDPASRVWIEEDVRADDEEGAVREALCRHADNPPERQCVGATIVGWSSRETRS